MPINKHSLSVIRGSEELSYSIKVAQLVREQKIEEAVQLLLQAVENEPEDPLHYVNLGTLLFQHNQYEEAESFFLQALQLDEEMATAHFGLASIHYEEGQYKAAATALRTCIALGMEDADVYYLLGMSYIHLHNPLLALPFLQRATELKEEVSYLFQYGLTLAKQTHREEAKEVFEKILTLDNHHADTLYNLGILYIHDNEIEKGFHFLKRTIDINPNHQLAKQALEQFTTKDES